MKRFIFSLLMLSLLFGCSNKEATEKLEYNGKYLQIGIVGDFSSLPKFSNTMYESVDLDGLTTSEPEYDAIIVMKDAFPQADKEQYVSFFNEIAYPVFFFGIEGFKDFAFTTEGVTLNMAKDKNGAFVQGFKNSDSEERKSWNIYAPEDLKESNINKYMVLQILESLNK